MRNAQYPSYFALLASGELEKRIKTAYSLLSHCTLCPWECGVDRTGGELGECQTSSTARVYSYMPHHGEERPLRGVGGSGTIFFSGCNMHCQFCQNADISQENYGMLVSADKIAAMMLDLQARGCHNINLVSPTHVVPQIMDALLIAAKKGLRLPLIYNTGGYDAINTLELLNGIIDIYMPDMKYADKRIAKKYSLIQDYTYHNQKAVKEMHRQVGDLQLDNKGIAVRGLLVRHLVLPNNISGTEQVMAYLTREISTNTYVNIMDQYRPEYHAHQFAELFRRVTLNEFQTAVNVAIDCGIERIDHLML
jgi:putative pyruvate formate lyase activating enzyme